MILMVIWYLVWNFQYGHGFNYSTLDEPTGIFLVKAHDTYISYNNWRFVYYYDLNEYYDDIDNFKESLDKMELICFKLKEQEPCQSLIYKHKGILANINIDVDYIESIQNVRRKRSAILGVFTHYILKPVFGVMSDEDAEEIYGTINDVIVKQETHSLILKDNLSIISRSLQTTKNSLDAFHSNLQKMNQYVENVTGLFVETEIELKQHINFEYISSLATLIAFEHERVTRTIKDTLKNTLRGEFTELISFEQFMSDIREVADDMDESSFMIMNKMRDLQEVVQIQGTILRKRMIIEITIPILNKNIYQLNQIVTLPMRHNDGTIILSVDNYHYLVNKETRIFAPIYTTDLQNCRHIFNNSLLCFPQTEMYFENEKICESNILFGHEIKSIIESCNYQHIADTNYIKRLTDNSYYVSLKETIGVRENCIKQPTTSHTINGTGILRMNLNCEIILNNMKISTKNTHIRKNIAEIIKPHKYQLISIANLTLIESKSNIEKLQKVVYINTNNDFSALINSTNKNIETLKKSGVVKQIRNDVFKWNIITFGVFIIVIVAVRTLIKALIKKWC